MPGLKVTDVPVRFSSASISSARTWRVNSYVFWLIGFWIKYAIVPFCCLAVKFQISRGEWDAGFGGAVRAFCSLMGFVIGVAEILAGGDAVSDDLFEFLNVRESSFGLSRPDQLSLRADVEDASGPRDER